MRTLDVTSVASAIGPVAVAASDRGLVAARPGDSADLADELGGRVTSARTARMRAALDGPQLDDENWPELVRDVARALTQIPAGQTRTYGQIAAAVGRPRAVRAVASAVGRNPVPVVVPCHRVVRSDGQVGGYLYGPEAKAALLEAEGISLSAAADPARRRVTAPR